MSDVIFTAIISGTVLALTLGPVFFVLLETSATKGFTSALVFDLGVILADIIFIAVALYGTTTFIDKIKDDPNILVFGGILLIIYGTIAYIKTSNSYKSIVREYQKVHIQKEYGKLFIKGFILNFINIGVLLGWLGFIVLANSITSSKQGVNIFIGTMLATYFTIDIFKILIAKKLKNKLTPKRIYKTKKIVSIVIFAFGVLLTIQGFFPNENAKLKERIETISPLPNN